MKKPWLGRYLLFARLATSQVGGRVQVLLYRLVMLSITCSACGANDSSKTLEIGPVLARALGGEPASLDPSFAADAFSTQVIQDLYEGLTTESPNADVIPGVAESWTVDAAGKTYTFKIRPTARWSNGEPIKAKDFVTAWQRVVDPLQASPVASDLRLIRGFDSIASGKSPVSSLGAYATADDVLVVNIERPAPYFPQLLSHSSTFPIYSQQAAVTHDPRMWVSNGPYVLSSWAPGAKIKLLANPNYWDHERVSIKTVSYLVETDPNAQLYAYRAGQVDITDTIPPNAIKNLLQRNLNEVFIAPYLATAYYGLNLVSSELKLNLKVRKALAMAIDRRQLVEALSLGQVPAYGIVPPATRNYRAQAWPWMSLSDEKRLIEARELYRQAGYSATHPLHLRMLYNANASIKQAAIIVAASWKQTLGVDMTLVGEEFRVFLESRHDRSKWDVLRLAWSADYNDASAFLDVFRTGSPNNDSGYSNKSFDQLLANADRSSNAEIRRELLESAEHTLLEDYPIIPLYFFVSKRLVKPYVLGTKSNPFDKILTKDLSISSRAM